MRDERKGRRGTNACVDLTSSGCCGVRFNAVIRGTVDYLPCLSGMAIVVRQHKQGCDLFGGAGARRGYRRLSTD